MSYSSFAALMGAVLVEDLSVANESSATRILWVSPTGEAQAVHTDSGLARVITTALVMSNDRIVAN